MGAVIELVRVLPRTSLERVKCELIARENTHGPRAAFIWAAIETKFWSHDPRAGRTLCRVAGGATFARVGPREEELIEIANWRRFLADAEANARFFGEHGLAAFMAAHAENCLHPYAPRAWSARSWASYNHALRRARSAA